MTQELTRDQEIVLAMSSYVNSMNNDYKEFAKLFGQQHRTLQQSFTKLCCKVVKAIR